MQLATVKSDKEWIQDVYNGQNPCLEALEFYAARMERLRTLLELEKEAVVSKQTPSAFVTFNKRWPAVVAAGAMHHHDRRYWIIDTAPEPSDVYWFALRLR